MAERPSDSLAEPLSRRRVFGMLTAGAVCAAGGAAAAEASTTTGNRSLLSASLLEETHRAASTLGRSVEPRPASDVEAVVAHCRSWDSSVYLYVDDETRGFVHLTPQGFAIAALCQTLGRKVAVRCWGHDSSWGGGVGRFDGALLAIDARDLPPVDVRSF